MQKSNLNKSQITVELASSICKGLANYPVTNLRAKELSDELTQLHSSISKQATLLEFDDEPSGFSSLLEKTKR